MRTTRENSFKNRTATMHQMLSDQSRNNKEIWKVYTDTFQISDRFLQACNLFGILKTVNKKSGWHLNDNISPSYQLISQLWDIERAILLKTEPNKKRSKKFLESAARGAKFVKDIPVKRRRYNKRTPLDKCDNIITFLESSNINTNNDSHMSNVKGLFGSVSLTSVNTLMKLFANTTPLDEILKITEMDSMEIIKVAKSVRNVVDTKYIIDFYKELFEF